MNAESIARALSNARRVGKDWMARCPLADEHAHGDANPSLSLADRDGGLLTHCQSRHAAEQDRVIAALKARGLWPGADGVQQVRCIVATYDYRDESGSLLFQVMRYAPKDFRQRRPDGIGGWAWNLKGVRRVPYRLPELIAARPDEIVFIVEGEKDANALSALGLVATTNPGGAGKWREEYNQHFSGRNLALLPDNDPTGDQHICHVSGELLPIAASVRIVRLPGLPSKGDVSDWLAAGGTAEKLIELVEETAPVTAADAADSTDQRGIFGFRTVDKYLSERAAMVERKSFWAGILREGEVSMLVGRAMAGKSTFACALTRALHLGIPLLGRDCVRGKVGYMALERNGVKVARLLRAWGLSDVHFLDQLPPMPLAELAAFIKAEIVRHSLEVVIVDHLQNLVKIKDSKDYSLVSLALEPFQKVSKETGALILLLHHQGKTEREGVIDVMGSEAYRAAVDTLLEAKKRNDDYFIRGEIRGEADLARIKVTINLETGEVESIDAHQAEMKDAQAKIADWLKAQELATATEIREALALKSETMWGALAAGVEAGTFERSGAGKKGDPFRFQLFGFSSEPSAGTGGTESESGNKLPKDNDLFSSRDTENRNADREPNSGTFEDLE